MQQIVEATQTTAPPMFEIEAQNTRRDEAQPKRWTKAEYHRLAELGFFEGRRTELIEGEIIEMPTMNTPHATALSLTDDALRRVFAAGFIIRNQMPMDLSDNTELVPDIAVVVGKARDYSAEHPSNAVLVVEVADTTLRHDKTKKAAIYAQNEIAEYWIVNIPERCLEFFRRPANGKYTEMFIFAEDAAAAPLGKPETQIAVADLLP